MLRIYGVTYDHTNNYGSCLQAYALKYSIEKMTVGVAEKCDYKIIPLWYCRDYPKKRIKNAIGLMLMNLYHKNFVIFEKRYLDFTQRVLLKDIAKLNRYADAFVCGSDVIWNPNQNKKVTAYFLDFAQKYSFSYAASFGNAVIDNDYIDTIKPFISKMDSVGVRESSAKKIVEELMGINCEVVVDPVLLLTKNEWKRIALCPKSEPYIFVYTTHMSKNIEGVIGQISKETGYKIVKTEWDASPSRLIKNGVLKVPSPDRWLQLLYNADFIITNSFHATAFSVLFHKKFYTVVNGDKAKGINIRMNDFLTTIGLEDRLISSVPENVDLSEIDYSDIDKKIEGMRVKSLAFLQDNLEAAYQQKKDRRYNDVRTSAIHK